MASVKTVAMTRAARVCEKIDILNGSYTHLGDTLMTIDQLSRIPALREILLDPDFKLTRQLYREEIDIYELRERNIALQQYILGRFLQEVQDGVNDGQRSRDYLRIINFFERHQITAKTYLDRLACDRERAVAVEAFKTGAAAYVKRRMSQEFENVVFAVEDMALIESKNARPNDKLEALLRPFQEAVTRSNHPTWYEVLGVLEEAGFDFDEQGLTEAIMPDNTFNTTIMTQSAQVVEPVTP